MDYQIYGESHIPGIVGIWAILLSVAPIFLGIAFLKNPATVNFGWVVSSLVKGRLNIGGALKLRVAEAIFGSKFGKVAIAGTLI